MKKGEAFELIDLSALEPEQASRALLLINRLKKLRQEERTILKAFEAFNAGNREALDVKLRASPGEFKEKMLSVLKGAPPEGIAVREIARRIGASTSTVMVWFAQYASKTPEVTKVGRGRYAWSSSSDFQGVDLADL